MHLHAVVKIIFITSFMERVRESFGQGAFFVNTCTYLDSDISPLLSGQMWLPFLVHTQVCVFLRHKPDDMRSIEKVSSSTTCEDGDTANRNEGEL